LRGLWGITGTPHQYMTAQYERCGADKV